MPVVTSVSVVGIMWGWMYNEQGLINAVLQGLHVVNDPVGWLSDDRIALFSVMVVTLWRGLGWYMVLYLAALQAIPKDLEEAARLDGATRWQRFWRVTVPMLMPTILLCTVLSTLSAMKVLEEVLIMTKGGPVSSIVHGSLLRLRSGHPRIQLPARARGEPRRKRVLRRSRMAQLPLPAAPSPVARCPSTCAPRCITRC